MKKWKIALLSLFIVAAVVFFWYIVEKDKDISDKTLVNSETVPVSIQHSYYMKIEGTHIVIYNKDHTVFEYTDLDPEFLPESVVKELYTGKYFRNQEELYEFLETYTS